MKKDNEIIYKGKKLTSETRIEGVGTVEVYGEIDIEKLVRRLLKSSLVKK